MTSLIRKDDDQFFVYLLSGASLRLAPQNTLTKFRNYLADEIKLKKSENWYVALQSLFMSNVSEPNTDKNKVIKVECPQIHQRIGEKPVLSIHSRTSAGSEHIYEAKVKQYFRLESELISYLDVNICNVDNSLLDLVSDQPTVIVLEFKKMSPRRSIHTLRVSNDDYDTNMYRDMNTSTNFRVQIPTEFSPKRIYNNPPWELALTSITYEPKFLQAAPKTDNKKIYMFKTGFRSRKRKNEDPDSDIVNMQQSNILSSTPSPMSESINSDVADSRLESSTGADAQISSPHLNNDIIQAGSESPTQTQERNKRSITISNEHFLTVEDIVYKNKTVLAKTFIGLFKKLARACRLDLEASIIHGRIVIHGENNTVPFGMAMPTYYANMLGLPISTPFWKEENYVYMEFKKMIEFTGLNIDFNANIPRTLLVYVNCVEPSFVGDAYVPLLKSFPVKRRDVGLDKYVTYEPKHMEFKKMSYSAINYLHFRFLKLNGEEVDVKDPIKINMTLTLRYAN
jgi:hypothetical protein